MNADFERTDPEHDELDRRIDQALRRRFVPPSDLEALPTRALRSRRSAPRTLVLAFAAAAAAVVALGLWVGHSSAPAEERPPGVVKRSPVRPRSAFDLEPATCRLGTLDPRDAEPRGVQRTDLLQLYRDMDACQRASAALGCEEEGGLAERLERTYGEPVELRPGAASLLHGPFLSDRWSTGTILTGTSEDQTAVLVAERRSTLACCVHLDLPEDSGLQMFTWEYGDLVLTEISPFEEPRFLDSFQ